MSIAASGLCLLAAALAQAGSPSTIDLAGNGVGVPPADFEFWRGGHGGPGAWSVVRDPSAARGAAIEQFSTDVTEDRFPLAIYKPVSAADLKVKLRFKLVRGTMQSAGVAIRLRTPDDYYLVRVSALETRIDLYRVADGVKERIAGIDADVFMNEWQTLGVTAEGDRFEVWFDNKLVLTAWDGSFRGDGHVALWTEDDNVTRFDSIAIEPLPWSERP